MKPHNRFLVLTLDEIDYYLKQTGEDMVQELTRLTNAITNVPQRMSRETLSRFGI